MTWLEGWSYRKSVTLSRPSGSTTDYQMKILLGESSGSSNAVVNCHGYCASDFDDVRFTNVSGTLLNYWIESITGTTPNQTATIWIKFDSIDVGATIFYMYYGNASAPSVTTGSGTFLLFDDFIGGSLDTGKWTDLGGVTVSGGNLIASADSSDNHGVIGNTIFTTNHAIRIRAKSAHINNTSYLEQIRWTNASFTKQVGIAFCHSMSTYNYKYYNYSDPNGSSSALVGVSADTFYVYDIMRNGTTDSRFLTDGSNAATISSYTEGSTDMYPYVGSYYSGSITTVDWILVRKYNVTEPSWGVWGEQEWVDGTPWLTGWNYRKRFSLSSTPAVANYQIKLLLGESSSSSNAQVHCNGLCDSAFDDIRFTNFDGVTILPYFIESVSGASPSQVATIWIKADYVGTTSTSFYLYYGNNSAVAVSTASGTLEFYDDFLVNPPNGSDWYHWLTNGSSAVSGSVLSVTGGSSAYEAYGCRQQFGTAYAFRGRVYTNSEAGTDTGIFSIDDRSATGSYAGTGVDSATARAAVGAKKWSMRREGTQTDNTRTAALTSWSVVEMRRTATSVQCLINDTSEGTYTVNVPTDSCGFLIYSYENTSTVYWDWVLVRKYQSPEPSYIGFQVQEPSLEMGWVSGWSKRLKFTIAGSNIAETCTDFPLMIYLDSTCSGIFSELGDNSKKISVRLADYTECYVEVETWDSSSQKAVLWTKIPTVSAGVNFDVYLFFDNGHVDNSKFVGVTTDTAAKNVWESAYKCVLHFAQTPAGSSSVKDSTSYSNHGSAGTGVSLTNGNYGKAYDFDATTNGYVNVSDNTTIDFSNALTINVLFYLDNAVAGTSIVSKSDGSVYSYGIEFTTSVIARAWADETGSWAPLWAASDTEALTTGSWIVLTGVFNGSTMTLYKNGVYKGVSSSSTNTLYNSDKPFTVGYNAGWSQKLDGKVAFVSLCGAVRSTNRVLTDYRNLMNQLVTTGGVVETAPSISLPYKLLKMSILETNVDSDLTNFPILVHLSSSCGTNSFDASDVFTALGSYDNRKKLAFTTVSGNIDVDSQCPVEIEKWDQNTLNAWLWVKVPTVYSGSNTSLYMYYGTSMTDNPSVGDSNSPAARNVWDSNFVAVYHMSQDPSGGVESIKNSAFNLLHATPYNMDSSNLISGAIDGSLNLNGSSMYTLTADNSYIRLTPSMTLEAMYQASDTDDCLICKAYDTSTYKTYSLFGVASNDRFYLELTTSNDSLPRGYPRWYFSSMPSSGTHHIAGAMTLNPDYTFSTNMYLDGVNKSITYEANSHTTNYVLLYSNLGLILGANNSYSPPQKFHTGVLDEVRISNTKRSTDWIKATYYSNIDSLVQFGPIEDYTPSYYYFSGIVREKGSPAEREVRAYRRDTGELVNSTASVSGTGAFYLETTYSGDHYVIAMDNESGDTYNALVYDYVVPITIS